MQAHHLTALFRRDTIVTNRSIFRAARYITGERDGRRRDNVTAGYLKYNPADKGVP